MKSDHVIVDYAGGPCMRCTHCGERHIPDTPMSAEEFADRLLGFVRMHRRCQPRPEPSKQVALFDAMEKREQRLTSPNQQGKCGLCGKSGQLEFYETGLMMVCLGGCSAIDASTDDPAPEIDPPGPEQRHGEGQLLDAIELRHLITCVRPRELWPTVREVEGWHEQVRADVQRWCRVEHTLAHPIAGLELPQRLEMPYVLSNIQPPKQKRGARPLTSPKKRRSVQP